VDKMMDDEIRFDRFCHRHSISDKDKKSFERWLGISHLHIYSEDEWLRLLGAWHKYKQSFWGKLLG